MEINELIRRCIRILHIARKPTPAEFNRVARVAALGMFLFGLIGVVIWFAFGLI